MSSFVLVHDGLLQADLWEEVRLNLELMGHRVYVPDLVQNGTKPTDRLANSVFYHWINDIYLLIREHHLSAVSLVSHGSGGFIAAAVASHIPEQIDRLIYVDALVPVANETLFDHLSATEKHNYQALAQSSNQLSGIDACRLYQIDGGVLAQCYHQHGSVQPAPFFQQAIHFNPIALTHIPIKYIHANKKRVLLEKSVQRIRQMQAQYIDFLNCECPLYQQGSKLAEMILSC